MTRKYELMAILPIKTEERDQAKENLDSVLSNNEIEVTETKDWGVKRMYHPIDEHRDGHYYLYFLNADPSQVKKADETLHLDTTILRYQFLRV
jgi:small subunit ribosomal protein S6